jgi:hypothetical protein
MFSCCGEHLLQELDRDFVEPEPGTAPRQKSQVSSMLGCKQPQIRVGRDARMPEHFERDVGIVLRLDKQRGHADPVEVDLRRLRRVVMVGSFKTE